MGYGRPGVYVEEALGLSAPDSDPSISTAVFVASHGRGPTTPTTIEQWADFTRLYGGFPSRTSMLPFALFAFFNNGGRRATVLRVPGTGAAVATRQLNDRHGTTPAPTLQIDAANPGDWGNSVYIEVTDAGADAFNLTVYHGGTSNLNVVERFNDLSMDPNSQRYVEKVVNSTRGGSSYIEATDLFSANQATLGYTGVRPATTTVGSPVVLAGGANGTEPTSTDIVNQLPQLQAVAEPYTLNFPGVSDATVINAAITHCEGQANAFLVVDPPQGDTVADVVAYAGTLQSSSYAALYYPWITVADPGANQPGVTKVIPPGGSVCGQIAQTDASRGVWKAPAGINHRIAGAVGLERSFSPADLDQLHSAHVNAVRHLQGVGVALYGARTLKKSGADKYVPIRRTMIFLRHALRESTRWAAFEPNDSLLWSDLEANISQFLTGFWQNGGLKGATVNEAFFVRADASVNTPAVVAAGEVRVEVGVALRYPAEFIIIRLSQWEGGSGAVEVTEATTL